MINVNDGAKVFELILAGPGMNELVKVDFKISKKNALLFSSVIERGVGGKDETGLGALLDSLPKDALEEFRGLANDFLQKAGLAEYAAMLKGLNSK